MSRMRCLATVGIAVLALAGCGGGEDEAAQPAAAPTEDATAETPAAANAEDSEAPEALPGLPAELAGYESWPKLNAAPIPPRDSDPHSGTKDVYASVASDNGVYPPGAIVVKEGTRPGASFVGLVAMMRKEAGANPEHNDWVMVEWVRDSPQDDFEEIGSGAVCTSCHVQARDRDYVFTAG